MFDGHAPSRITVDLIWQRLIAILEDQAQTLIRTAFSTSTRESGDLSTGLFDMRGRMVAQAVTGTPGHVNSMALAVGHFLEKFPLSELDEGDVLISNDPWIGSGHLHDFTVVSPVFHRSRPVGVVANTIHVVDIGGLGFGADARDVHEEGLCVPICKMIARGEVNGLLLEIIRENVRAPDQVSGDLFSSVAGNALALERVGLLLEEYRLDDLESVADTIIERTQREVETRINRLPEGVYTSELKMDGYGEPIHLALTLSITDKEITLDFDGSAMAVSRGINVVLNYTTAYATFGVNCVLNPDIPCNHGSLLPIKVTAPSGSIVNAQRPSSVSARHIIGHMLPDLVFGALANVIDVPAEGAGLIWNPSIRGRKADGSSFTTVTFNAGGGGAQRDRDGWNTTAFPSGVKALPVELLEASAPVLIMAKELMIDSGGVGAHRGGLGQRIEIAADGENTLLVNAMFDRLAHPALGRAGGGEGSYGAARINSGRAFAGKGLQEVRVGETLILELPGGAGYGNPRDRSREDVLEDLRGGYVSPAAALRTYGVVNNT